MSKLNPSPAIRLSRTKEVAKALDRAKKQYPTLSDPEILKLGLAKLVTEGDDDLYYLGMGRKNHLKKSIEGMERAGAPVLDKLGLDTEDAVAGYAKR